MKYIYDFTNGWTERKERSGDFYIPPLTQVCWGIIKKMQ